MIKMVFLFGMLFFLVPKGDMVFASSQQNSVVKHQEEIKREQLISWNNFLQVMSSFIYVVLWPLVALAGLAMDNQLIYASFMHLDTSLWNMWQIVRTFANYALGLIFLIGILLYNLSPERKIGFGSFMKSVSGPADLIKKTLLASVLIQASWFILMAAVDISTVLTYSVGAIPTTLVTTTDPKFQDEKMLQMHTLFNLSNEGLQKDDQIDEVIVSYWSPSSKSETYIAPCATAQTKSDKQSFIIGRAFSSLTGHDHKLLLMKPGYCSHMGSLVSFADFYRSDLGSYAQALKSFESMVEDGDIQTLQKLFSGGMIMPISPGALSIPANFTPQNASVEYLSTTYTSSWGANGCDIFGIVPIKPKDIVNGEANYHCLYQEAELAISNIISKGKSMTGPFVALYSNVFHFADLKGYGSLGNWQTFILSLINVGFGILLILPLGALVIVLFVRVAVLWIAIATSPFIVLINVFEGVFSKDILPSWLSPSELIKLLLAPVLISFAVSISLIFMTALKDAVKIDTSGNPQLAYTKEEARTVFKEISGLTQEEDSTYSILGFIKLHLNSGLINLSRMLTMIFGIGITWFLLFWAIKQTKIGVSVGGTLQKLGERTLSTMPIIPVGGGTYSFGAVKNFTTTQTDKFLRSVEQENLDRLGALFDKNKAAELEKRDEERVQKHQFHQNLDVYKSPENAYTAVFAPDFRNKAEESISQVDQVASHYTTYTSSSMTKELFDKKKGEIEEVASKGYEDLKVRAREVEASENADSPAMKIKEVLEHLLNVAKSRQFTRLEQAKKEFIFFGTKKYKIVEQEGKLVLESVS